MKSLLPVALLLLAAIAQASSPEDGQRTGDRPKLVVLDLVGAGGVPQDVASALSEAVVKEVEGRRLFDVRSSKEVQTLLGLERQKQMLGCADETACLAEVAGALGARFVLSGSLAKLGETYQLSLQTMDSTKAQPIGRSVRLAESLERLSAQLPYAVAEATGTPLPPPPSRVLPYSLMGAGAAFVLGSSAFGLYSVQQEALIQQELEVSTNLGGFEAYRQRADSARMGKTLSVVGLGLGAALIGTGLLLNPAEVVSASGGISATFVPSLDGFALVGVMP